MALSTGALSVLDWKLAVRGVVLPPRAKETIGWDMALPSCMSRTRGSVAIPASRRSAWLASSPTTDLFFCHRLDDVRPGPCLGSGMCGLKTGRSACWPHTLDQAVYPSPSVAPHEVGRRVAGLKLFMPFSGHLPSLPSCLSRSPASKYRISRDITASATAVRAPGVYTALLQNGTAPCQACFM